MNSFYKFLKIKIPKSLKDNILVSVKIVQSKSDDKKRHEKIGGVDKVVTDSARAVPPLA